MGRSTLVLIFLLSACDADPDSDRWTEGRVALDGDEIQVALWFSAAYEDRSPLADGGEEIEDRPIRHARFEVLAQGDELMAWGTTDAQGEGQASFLAMAGEPLRVRVLAMSGVRDAAVVVRSESYAIHALESATAAAGPTVELDLYADAAGGGGPFNLFSDVSAAVLAIAARYGPVEGLDVVWTSGVGHSCGSCYMPWARAMLVGGSEQDPDQWDDSVILHELGHWFEEELAATTNPGGAHDGLPCRPDQAWSEGFASFFGQALIGEPVYVDSYAEETWSMDLERMGGDHAWGTEGGALDGAVSENLVAAVLWDLFDDGDAEPNDHLSAELFIILDPAVIWLGAPDLQGVGFPGVDLADYLTGWIGTGTDRWWSVAQIVLARDYPYPFHAPPLPAP